MLELPPGMLSLRSGELFLDWEEKLHLSCSTKKRESVSCSVLSNSSQLHGLEPARLQGILHT